jgi:hypothetical protein
LQLLGIGRGNKVPKSSLAQDEEGDFFPDEFVQKQVEFTREEEGPCYNKFNPERNGTNFN